MDTSTVAPTLMYFAPRLTTLRADETLSLAQEAVRLALFIIPQPFILVTKPNAAFCRALTKRLKKWLESSDEVGLWAPRYDLLFSVPFVMAHISIDEAEWRSVLSCLSTLISSVGMQPVEQIDKV